jgi:predicted ester cyclase
MVRLDIATLLAFGALASFAAAQSSPTTEARNKAIATRVFEEIFNQGRFEVANEIYSPDFQNHGLHRVIDLKTDQDAVHAEKQAFPDLRMQVERLIAEGDWLTVLWTFRGTHTAGGYGGLPATGTPIEMRGITIWRIVDGKIRDEWSSFDGIDDCYTSRACARVGKVAPYRCGKGRWLKY